VVHTVEINQSINRDSGFVRYYLSGFLKQIDGGEGVFAGMRIYWPLFHFIVIFITIFQRRKQRIFHASKVTS
jgi:hypothetical protein